jgi:hypothetical protein
VALQDPGNWTADAAQTLESGITLTIENTSRIATITGNIEVLKAGTANQRLRFDIEKLISMTVSSSKKTVKTVTILDIN